MQEISESKRRNGTLSLMHQSQKTWEDILKRVVLWNAIKAKEMRMSSGLIEKKFFHFGAFWKPKNKNQILRVLIFAGFCNNCEILSTWNGKVKSRRSSLNSSSKTYIQNSETELEPHQTSEMELFVKVVNCLISKMESFVTLVNNWKPKAVNYCRKELLLRC